MILLAKVGVGLVGMATVGAAMLCSEGFLQVKVHEKQANGTHIAFIAPAVLVPAALEFVPNHHLAKASRQLRPYMPIIDAAMPALEDCPDTVLVEVVDPSEHVRIAKEHGSIVVDVNDNDDVVHVAVPLRAAESTLHVLANAN